MADRPGRKSTPQPLVVLGVDPGTLVTGFGIIARTNGILTLLGSGTICNNREELMPRRLQRIYRGLGDVVKQYHPVEFALESAFYGKNAQSALKLGQARGVAILAAAEFELPLSEYSPREVKRAVVGNGTASKEQVQYMVRSLLKLGNAPMVLDASDALAVAICHMHRMMQPASKAQDWKSYIAAHPERVRS